MTQDLMAEIVMHCPECGERGLIKIKKNIIKSTKNGIAAINVSQNIICKHSFIAYIDRNLIVRDCFICDFKIKIPDVEIEQMELEGVLDFDVDIIRINLLPTMLINLLRATFQGNKVLLILDNDFLQENLMKFFAKIFVDSFEWQISILPLNEYKKNKKIYNKHVVLESTKIILDKEKIINQKKIKIEQAIVNKFFLEIDSKSSVIILRSEIEKINAFCKKLIEFNSTLTEDQEFSLADALDYLISFYNVEIQLPYLRFLEDIVINCFGVQLQKIAKSNEFLDFL